MNYLWIGGIACNLDMATRIMPIERRGKPSYTIFFGDVTWVITKTPAEAEAEAVAEFLNANAVTPKPPKPEPDDLL